MIKTNFKKLLFLILSAVLIFTFSACAQENGDSILKPTPPGWEDEEPGTENPNPTDPTDPNYEELLSDPYRTYYEIFVYSFCDSNGDGIGDLKGITSKLDYLNDGNPDTDNDLGITGLWLTPINPSPTYHKYDVTNYYGIDPAFGTMSDFENLLSEAHKRGIRVIMDLVINHTAYNHPWFQSALTALKNGDNSNKYIRYYNFRQSGGTGYSNKGCPSGWYYECIFWDQMPDLNMDNEEVRQEIAEIAEFWLNKGVDGFRLDAAQHVYGPMNSPDHTKNIAFWTWFNATCKQIKQNCYLVGEVYNGNQTLLANYYGSGFDSFFNFSFGVDYGQFNKTVIGGGNNSSYYAKNLPANLKSYQDAIKAKNSNAIDATFLTNHDNNRVASNLGGDLARMKSIASLYLLLPGNPFIYYGEELGQSGSGIDENKRSPMIWSKTSNSGICRPVKNCTATPVSSGVSEQLNNANSLLRHYIHLIKIRNKYPEIARGTITSYTIDNVLSIYKMTYNGSSVIIMHNLSSSAVTINFSKIIYGYSQVADFLVSEAVINGDSVTIPAMSTSILR